MHIGRYLGGQDMILASKFETLLNKFANSRAKLEFLSNFQSFAYISLWIIQKEGSL